MAKGSVAKGTGYLALARISGMAGGFVLFLLLTWRSRELAGHFRTAAAYFVIMDLLPLLGMHRWLATEMGRHGDRAWALFRMATLFAVGVAALFAGLFVAIAHGGAYGPDISRLLDIVALSTIPSAVNLCVLSGLVGTGYSDQSGALSAIEGAVRAVAAIVLIVMGAGLVWVMLVFVLARWAVAAGGLVLIHRRIGAAASGFDPALACVFLSQVPTLGLALVGFLALRNAAMLLLPLVSTDTEAGLYAAPFQLFDLLLLAPSVLVISCNYAFVSSAQRSVSALRRSTTELLSITALFIFPLGAIAAVLAGPVIGFLFGPAYAGSVPPFQVLVLAAVILSLDQVLALSMATAGAYRADRTSILAGGLVAVAVTPVLGWSHGAAGAAVGLLAAAVITLGLRLFLMRTFLRRRTLLGALEKPAAAAVAAGLSVWGAVAVLAHVDVTAPPILLLLSAPGGAVYLGVLHYGGALSPRRLRRVQHFITRPG